VRQLARVETWAQATKTGDLAEVDGLDERSPVIPLVSSTRDNCLGSDCPAYARCHVVLARRDAMAADLVVSTITCSSPTWRCATAAWPSCCPRSTPPCSTRRTSWSRPACSSSGTTLSTATGDRPRTRPARRRAAACARPAGLAGTVRRPGPAARELRLACAGERDDIRATLKLRFDDCAAEGALDAPLAALAAAAGAAADAADAMEGTAADFARLAQRCRDLAGLTARFGADLPSGHVRWVDLTTHQARLVESPLDIRAMLTEQRQKSPKAWVFTSATLGAGEDFDWFTRSTGLEDAVHLRVGSPFDYPTQARLWVPPRLPLPNAPGHPDAVGKLAARIAHRLGGRTFVLTTTLRVLPLIAEAARTWLARQGAELEVLVQGSEPGAACCSASATAMGAC
jgi:ATP-dependent DNA helicase DinG